jgi:hypothetical protein
MQDLRCEGFAFGGLPEGIIAMEQRLQLGVHLGNTSANISSACSAGIAS